MLEIKNLKKTFDSGTEALSGVNLKVKKGEFLSILGPSGSGKSLTARAMMSVLDVSPGLQGGHLRYPTIDAKKDWFVDVVGKGMSAQRKLLKQTQHLRGHFVTYSPQSASSALNPGRTIGRQMEMAIARRTTPPASLSQEILRILAQVGLDRASVGALPSELSGGMCQRAALAIAIAPNPQLVIADEPETGLDPVLRRAVIELLVKVVRQNGAGLVLISHHEDTVERIADAVVRLQPHVSEDV
mgnify:CR=1 FL=1